MSLRSTVYFAGWGGDQLGWEQVPGVSGRLAANHNPVCVQVHSLNFPGTEHLPPGDVEDIDLATLPYTEMFWASPACPEWTDAKGVKRYFDQSNQYSMFDEELGRVEDPAASRSRALIEQIPRYLRAMAARGTPVLAGAMENVIQCRRWDDWKRWIKAIQDAAPGGYDVRVIALNSGHVLPRACLPVPQSRDRLYVAYWLKALGRTPDWDKWLRPKAWCGSCEQTVDAIQSWKKPGADMGRYGIRHGQYVYRCPSKACRAAIVDPITTPAAVAIDWNLPPGAKIADRSEPLAENTLERIRIGLAKFGGSPMLSPAGGTWRTEPTSLGEPMPARTTRESDALVLPPLVVQTSGRAAPTAVSSAGMPLPTQTTRRELAVAIPPFIAELRGGGSKKSARSLTEPLATFAASGFHHGLVQPPGSEHTRQLLVPYYRTGRAHPISEPMGTLTTRDRFGLLGIDPAQLLGQCTFRMLEATEIRAGMAFPANFRAVGDKRTQARGYGNAVTPAAAEVIGCALVEAITGTDIERTVAA
ncbi:DNA methyltransferase [Nocardia noduli]|uniref:DNA methyltransferase n=1 Tax=Nocardia noduli TaxID=2815722 RepID=UPI001C2427FF|nr:DNA methyltransferase [Nocardia noduli]